MLTLALKNIFSRTVHASILPTIVSLSILSSWKVVLDVLALSLNFLACEHTSNCQVIKSKEI